ENDGPSLIRIDLQTDREYKSGPEESSNLVPKAYISALGKFLLAEEYYDDGPEEPDESDGAETPSRASSSCYFLDPETGRISTTMGEVRPLLQQTFRLLQSAGKANEYWAAIPDRRRNETEVGKYDARLLRFKPLIRLPKIAFDSMDMWVDGAGSKLYFVYNGHLLSVPFADPPHR
ncbi:MAG TPA: hypothetical protein VGJ02_01140, partial [Pyrinomonadaceae bacterium]